MLIYERQLYYNKLRAIETLINEAEDSGSYGILEAMIRSFMYV